MRKLIHFELAAFLHALDLHAHVLPGPPRVRLEWVSALLPTPDFGLALGPQVLAASNWDVVTENSFTPRGECVCHKLSQHVSFFLRTRVQFLASMSGSSQSPVTLASERSDIQMHIPPPV